MVISPPSTLRSLSISTFAVENVINSAASVVVILRYSLVPSLITNAPAVLSLILKLVATSVKLISPPCTVKSPETVKSEGDARVPIDAEPAIYRSPPIPTPPETVNAPVVDEVDAVTSLTLIATPFAKFQSAPVTSSLSSVVSSYLILTSLLVPKVRYVSSGITTSPSPSGSILMSPSVLVDEIVFPFKVRLSTFHTSILLAESTITAEFAVRVPCPWSSMSVKYLPPITSIFAAMPPVSVPVPKYILP